ncbi:MAG: SOS response-associated peptidase, partial [Planctomycetota bacterium]
MCGRFTLRTPAAAWVQEFLPLWSEDELSRLSGEHAIAARYNIAPTQSICTVRNSADDSIILDLSLLRWGLVPFWASDISVGSRMINARSETVHEKRSFKSAFEKRRCLIPADGYFEWQTTSDGKQPYLIEHRDGKMLAMAGLWERNRKLGQSQEEPLESCTIVTTSSN